MATTKKTTANTAEKETTTVKKESASAKKSPAKKTVPKKIAPKKPAAVKSALKADTVDTKINFFVEYGGAQVSVDEVVNNIKTTLGKDAKEISVYLKPEESKAYFVADGKELDMDVFFC